MQIFKQRDNILYQAHANKQLVSYNYCPVLIRFLLKNSCFQIMAPKTSSILEFFETHPTKSEMVICKTCQKAISIKGRSPTSAKNHLKSMHKVQYLSFLELENEQKAKKDNLKDITIEQSFRRKEQRLWDNKDPKSQRFDRLIAEMVAVDDLPLSFVENIGFHAFAVLRCRTTN